MAISQELLKRVILDQHEVQDWPKVYIPRTIENRLNQLKKTKKL